MKIILENIILMGEIMIEFVKFNFPTKWVMSYAWSNV